MQRGGGIIDKFVKSSANYILSKKTTAQIEDDYLNKNPDIGLDVLTIFAKKMEDLLKKDAIDMNKINTKTGTFGGKFSAKDFLKETTKLTDNINRHFDTFNRIYMSIFKKLIDYGDEYTDSDVDEYIKKYTDVIKYVISMLITNTLKIYVMLLILFYVKNASLEKKINSIVDFNKINDMNKFLGNNFILNVVFKDKVFFNTIIQKIKINRNIYEVFNFINNSSFNIKKYIVEKELTLLNISDYFKIDKSDLKTFSSSKTFEMDLCINYIYNMLTIQYLQSFLTDFGDIDNENSQTPFVFSVLPGSIVNDLPPAEERNLPLTSEQATNLIISNENDNENGNESDNEDDPFGDDRTNEDLARENQGGGSKTKYIQKNRNQKGGISEKIKQKMQVFLSANPIKSPIPSIENRSINNENTTYNSQDPSSIHPNVSVYAVPLQNIQRQGQGQEQEQQQPANYGTMEQIIAQHDAANERQTAKLLEQFEKLTTLIGSRIQGSNRETGEMGTETGTGQESNVLFNRSVDSNEEPGEESKDLLVKLGDLSKLTGDTYAQTVKYLKLLKAIIKKQPDKEGFDNVMISIDAAIESLQKLIADDNSIIKIDQETRQNLQADNADIVEILFSLLGIGVTTATLGGKRKRKCNRSTRKRMKYRRDKKGRKTKKRPRRMH
jgi:hypothetical protein